MARADEEALVLHASGAAIGDEEVLVLHASDDMDAMEATRRALESYVQPRVVVPMVQVNAVSLASMAPITPADLAGSHGVTKAELLEREVCPPAHEPGPAAHLALPACCVSAVLCEAGAREPSRMR